MKMEHAYVFCLCIIAATTTAQRFYLDEPTWGSSCPDESQLHAIPIHYRNRSCLNMTLHNPNETHVNFIRFEHEWRGLHVDESFPDVGIQPNGTVWFVVPLSDVGNPLSLAFSQVNVALARASNTLAWYPCATRFLLWDDGDVTEHWRDIDAAVASVRLKSHDADKREL